MGAHDVRWQRRFANGQKALQQLERLQRSPSHLWLCRLSRQAG